METKKNSILDFLSEKNVIEIPVWQREFVWDEAQAMQLYEDVASMINNLNLSSHFLGIFIYKPFLAAFSGIELIDGQQRIITMSIFLCALCNHFGAENYKNALLFSLTTKEILPKIRSLNPQIEIYQNVLLNEDFAYMENSIYSQIYRFFLNKIETNNYTLDEYFSALKRFEIVEIKIMPSDNAQLIYDSLNSTGLKLTLFEKIKNYIFMGLREEEQFSIWQKYWNPLEKLFSDKDEQFCDFMISYISMQTEKNVAKNNLSIAFNKFYNLKRNYKTAEEIVSEFFKFAQYYVRIKNADFTEEISVEMEKIIAFYDKPEIYSFLFEITDDFQNGLIPKKIFVEILENTYNYLLISKEKNEQVDFSSLSKTISKLLAQKYEQRQ